ncbi:MULTISPECIES: hypothetical protein [Bacillus cereus group]|nr:hypothetical protein [Bacillus cereus]MCC2503080.1 hypothetical protein [Bacillus cereus]MCH5474164.1 hypothetical protein [Bacillus cereus]MDA2209857.1 hypothetical protein [Bacillus cereus]MDA2220759.1 hypothetical protein [Bacillus cereus]MDA2248574.1 hypothetical protein [Bacillus cereus]
MSFRYDMRGKDPQQQAIVRAKDKADQRLKEERKKEVSKPNYIDKNIQGYKVLGHGSYSAVDFYKDSKFILKLGVSIAAQKDVDCGLNELDIHQWLWDTGNLFVNDLKEEQRLLIKVVNVDKGKLITLWSDLEKIEV